MTLPVYLALGACGGVGAMLRFVLDGIVSERGDGAEKAAGEDRGELASVDVGRP